MDIWAAYNGLLLSGGLPQEYFDHPGYLTILALSEWFRLLHGIGILHVYSFQSLSAAADPNAAWTAVIRAGRVLSLIIAIAFVAGFGALVRRLVGDWRVAALGAFALAFSGGLSMQARSIRTELISSGLVTVALLMLLIAARNPRMNWRPALIGLAACFATLAFVNKVQTIFLICSIPLIVIWFGELADDPAGFWRTSYLARVIAACAMIGAVVVSIPAAALVHFGLTEATTSIFHWRPAVGAYGVYQPIIAGWLIFGVFGFAWWWRVPALETIATLAAIAAGAALGLLSLDIRYNPQNVLVVMNPLEQLTAFATRDPHLAASGTLLNGLVIRSLLKGIGTIVAIRTFVLDPSARPTIFLEWFVIAAAIMAWRAGERRLVAQVAALMGVVWAIDLVSTLRGLEIGYFIYTDPLVIIAACLLLAGYAPLQTHPWCYQIGVGLIAIHVVLSHAEPVKHTFQSSKPLYSCVDHFDYTRRIEMLPFCPPKT